MKSREDRSQLPQDPGLIWDCLSGWHCWRGNDELAAIEDASLTCRQPQVDRTTALLLGSFVLIIESTTATLPQTFTLCLQTTYFISFTVRGSLVCLGWDQSLLKSWSPHCMGSVQIFLRNFFSCPRLSGNSVLPKHPDLWNFEVHLFLATWPLLLCHVLVT